MSESELMLFDFLPEEEQKKYKRLQSIDWYWTMENDYPKMKNGLKVFSCFACGGGSTMGYKLTGCDVIGCVEIDSKMNEIYQRNHIPRFNYCMDIRDFNKIPNESLPEELFNLDILDGSPPCTTFSMAGDRKESWGKKKKFREGQKEQTLDDLSFVFIDTVRKLKPKVVIMENVEGLILGEAFAYVQRIYKDFKLSGYSVNHWLLKGEEMGVPQRRHRVFFIACRNDLNIDPSWLNMAFNYEPVLFGEVREERGAASKTSKVYAELIKHRIDTDHSIADIYDRVYGKYSGFNTRIIHDDEVCDTITAGGGSNYRFVDGLYQTNYDIARCQTFPVDYDFGTQSPKYICGMSVPPIMIKRIVTRLIEEGVFNYKIQERGD